MKIMASLIRIVAGIMMAMGFYSLYAMMFFLIVRLEEFCCLGIVTAEDRITQSVALLYATFSIMSLIIGCALAFYAKSIKTCEPKVLGAKPLD